MKRTLRQDVLLWKKYRPDAFKNLCISVVIWLVFMLLNHISIRSSLLFFACVLILAMEIITSIVSFLTYRQSIKDMSQGQLEARALVQKIREKKEE
jgi:uncharacterized membrane protein